MVNLKKIYLDNAATTLVAPEVRKIIDNVNDKYFGNPSSVHSIGQESHRLLDENRRKIADFVGANVDEIIFTSGGSEGDNLAIRGIVAENRKQNTENDKPHVITSLVEHHAVLHTVQELEKEGLIEATYLRPTADGIITADTVKEAIKDNTILVSLIYVNNETGVVTPIEEIGEVIQKENSRRAAVATPHNLLLPPPLTPPQAGGESLGRGGKIYFHSDAVQAAEWEEMNADKLKIDLLTFTAHKFHGPKGVGALYIRKGTPIKPQITGGSQEFGKRAGTENLAGIAGMAGAITQVKSQESKVKSQVESLRDKLEQGIVDSIPDVIINGKGAKRAPHVSNISFINAEGEAIILNLDFLGIAVSSGSACTSRSLEPSHVLTAMGIPPEKAHGSIRFSLSRYTTEPEIDKVLEVLPPIIKKLREMSPFK